jgi:PleD family two-component response regulator
LLERLRTVGETQSGWSVSMGIGEVLAGESSLIHAIRRADMSLYEAKARGRARIAA